jgi:MFS family permease
MTEGTPSRLPTSDVPAPNQMNPMQFIVGFGIVSALADIVYEGARSIIGPYLGSLGASAFVVGLISGAGEASALVLRLGTGRIVDQTKRPWPQTLVGYVLTAVCVPLLAVTGSLTAAGLLYNGERVGKAVRTPARDTMLAHATAEVGRGYGFGLHEALDQIGAMSGPLIIAATIALGGHYHLAFAILAIPGGLAVLMLVRLRAKAPDPAKWEPAAQLSPAKQLSLDARLPRQFWHYAAFSAVTMLGFPTWAVLAVHLSSRHLVSASVVPVLYALAMASASVAAVVFGRLYDRQGLRGLLVLPFLGAAVPMLSFASATAAFVIGAAVWGVAMGVHESTLRAAVADLVPAHRRGAGYGTFTAIYGLAWLGGAALIGLLSDHGRSAAITYVGVTQAVALAVLIALLRTPAPSR